jgi:IclR family pca regulon transcriptional regulator
VLDRDCVAYVAYTPGGNSPHVLRSIGARLPATATALGRILLAHQPLDEVRRTLEAEQPARLTPFTLVSPDALLEEFNKIRTQGYAAVYQQLEMGLFSIGVPIYDRANHVIAAISASVWQREPDVETLERDFLSPLLSASRKITSGLPY